MAKTTTEAGAKKTMMRTVMTATATAKKTKTKTTSLSTGQERKGTGTKGSMKKSTTTMTSTTKKKKKGPTNKQVIDARNKVVLHLEQNLCPKPKKKELLSQKKKIEC